MTKDDELDALVAQTSDAVARQLRKIWRWTADRDAHAPARIEMAHAFLANIDTLLAKAQTDRSLGAQDARHTKQLLRQKIHQSVGVRNELLALRAYERQHGCIVRLANDHWYWLEFPPLPAAAAVDGASASVSFAALDMQSTRRRVACRRRRYVPNDALTAPDNEKQFHDSNSNNNDNNDDDDDDAAQSRAGEADAAPSSCYFSICGMVDGVADVLSISADDDWALTPVVVEVKNRLRAFRDPPPLHDHVQMAVYLKMLGLAQGDLVQCLHSDRAAISVSRISLTAFPLGPQYRHQAQTSENERGVDRPGDLWTDVILPRLYQYTAMLHKVRSDDLLRLAFLSGTAIERLAMLQHECDFL